MNEVYVGVAVLISIVLAQFVVARLKRGRMLGAWTDAEDAMREGRFEDAEKSLVRCVAIAPLWMHGPLALGMVQGKLGKFDEAERGLLRTGELHPKEAEPQYALGMLYATVMTDREEDAVAAFKTAAERNPAYAAELAADRRLDGLRAHPDFPKAEASAEAETEG